MNPTEQPQTGFTCSRCVLALVAMIYLCVVGIAPNVACAAFTRPFVHQITGTPTTPFKEKLAVTVDSTSDLWVGETYGAIDEFEGTGQFTTSLEPVFPSQELKENATAREVIASNASNGDFLVTGDQTKQTSTEPTLPGRVEVFNSKWELLNRWSRFNGPNEVAVDNSSSPLDPSRCQLSVCTVYVAHAGTNEPPGGDGLAHGVEKFSVNAAGEPTPAPFSGSAGYLKGNEITGPPEGIFTNVKPAPSNLTVDAEGNIYVVAQTAVEGSEQEQAVFEYGPDGLFEREFGGNDAPRLTFEQNVSGFGGREERITGVAVDPVSQHVLVAVVAEVGQKKVGAIDEFDSSGAYLNQITEIETSSGVRKRLGEMENMVVDSTGTVYAVDGTANAVDVFGAGHFLPTVTLSEPTTRAPANALVSGTFDPEGEQPNECWFEYVSERAFDETGFNDLSTGGKVPCQPAAGTIPADSEAHQVEGHLSGLLSGETYVYRLSAGTSGALGGSSQTEPLTFTAPGAPRVAEGSEVARNISSAFADLHATIDPLGADTSYFFEYGQTRAYSSTAPLLTQSAPRGVDIGPGGATGDLEASVVQQVGGLTPDTTYHFRVVAESEIEGKMEVTDGPDSVFATEPTSVEGLPDSRVYELLTPPNKGSAEDMFASSDPLSYHQFANIDVGYASESGEEFLLQTKAAFGEPAHSFAASGENAYVFRRDPVAERWQTLPLASPSLGVQSVDPEVFDSSDFSRIGIFDDSGSALSATPNHFLSLLGPPGGLLGAPCESSTKTECYEQLQNEVSAGGAQKVSPGTRLAGASRDLNHIVLESLNHSIVPGVDEGQDVGSRSLWEWSNGELALVSVNPEGAPFACGAVLGHIENGFGGSNEGASHGAVSDNGERMFFTAPDPDMRYNPESARTAAATKGCWNQQTSNAPQLYMRSGGQTIELSAPEAGVSDPKGQQVAVYVGASEDGSKVFFVTATELTSDDLGNHDPELYECEIVEEGGEQGCKLTRISAGESHDAAAYVAKVPAISADGSAVYFTAFGALAPGAPTLTPPSKGERSYVAGPVNLYRYDTLTGATIFVATVNGADYGSSGTGQWWTDEDGNALVAPLQLISSNTPASWYTTPDGRYLLFASVNSLTGYSTAEAKLNDCPPVELAGGKTGHCSEVYRFDAQAAERGEAALDCLSCDRSGEAPTSNSFFGSTAGSPILSGGPVRAMSDNGACAFFDSAEPLVKQAQNKTLDVYEWEAPGAGHCESDPPSGTTVCEEAQGCIYLIGSGNDSYPSYFLGASANGANVFFGTHARLVPQDTDDAGDLYDARMEGGFATPAGIGPCEGDACSSPPLAPLDATPSSLTFSGPGNVSTEAPIAPNASKKTAAKRATPKCKKPKRLTRGKCVKPKRKSKQSSRKSKQSSQRKGAK